MSPRQVCLQHCGVWISLFHLKTISCLYRWISSLVKSSSTNYGQEMRRNAFVLFFFLPQFNKSLFYKTHDLKNVQGTRPGRQLSQYSGRYRVWFPAPRLKKKRNKLKSRCDGALTFTAVWYDGWVDHWGLCGKLLRQWTAPEKHLCYPHSCMHTTWTRSHTHAHEALANNILTRWSIYQILFWLK